MNGQDFQPLAQELLNYATDLARTSGYQIDPSFEQVFLRAVEGHSIAFPDHNMDEARANTERVMEASMAAAADRTLNAPAFFSALSGLCPLWPFC